MDGKNKVYTHGAVYMGKSKDETDYFMTKNGAFRKPEIMTLEGLKKEYGDKYEVWNKNNQ